jgi:ATP-dependent helicase/nuclease subunit A
MAVLLRAPGSRTEAFAREFHRAGIPLAAARGGFLEASEVTDLVSLLQVLDNPLQDIPLLAVLRSPLVGLTLDELATIRAGNNTKPFWLALRQFAQSAATDPAPGESQSEELSAPQRQETAAVRDLADQPSARSPLERSLRVRLATFFDQHQSWRQLVRQVGPSLCLEQVLSDTGYDLLLGVEERGPERVANVRQLLELARQFDPYLRQGLYRFLRHLKALEEAGDTLEPAPVTAQDAVQLMSIHRSKGLEFPVVVLAGLGARFNFRDLHDTILLDSEYGLAPKAMTADGGGRYPTLPFWLAERHQRAVQLGEELRLLYVATTRSRDRLILTGTAPRKHQGQWPSTPGAVIADHQLLTAQAPLDWLMPWLSTVCETQHWNNDAKGQSPLLSWTWWDPTDALLAPEFQAKTKAQETPPDQGWSAETIEALRARIEWRYAHDAATREPAKSSVSALRRRAAELADADVVRRFQARGAPPGETGELPAAERGTLHHRFQQFVNLALPCDEACLDGQRADLVKRGVFTKAEAALLDLKALAVFWQSDMGRAIRHESAWVRRELPFTARLDAEEAARILGVTSQPSLTGEFVVIQGVVDLVVLHPAEIWLLDFKTDRVRGKELEARVESYRPQLHLYALALERIYHRPVTHCWLHFLDAGRTMAVD